MVVEHEALPLVLAGEVELARPLGLVVVRLWWGGFRRGKGEGMAGLG